MNSLSRLATFEAEVKELVKRYVRDAVVLIGSISKHYGCRKKKKKKEKACEGCSDSSPTIVD